MDKVSLKYLKDAAIRARTHERKKQPLEAIGHLAAAFFQRKRDKGQNWPIATFSALGHPKPCRIGKNAPMTPKTALFFMPEERARVFRQNGENAP